MENKEKRREKRRISMRGYVIHTQDLYIGFSEREREDHHLLPKANILHALLLLLSVLRLFEQKKKFVSLSLSLSQFAITG